MKRVFKLKNLGCANCASKMEAGISKLEGVEFCSIAFMTQRLTIEAEQDAFPEILEKAQAVIRKYERNCEIVK